MKKSLYKRIKKAIVLQHDQSDCGVACLLTLIRYYDGSDTLDNLRRLSGTSITGTTLLGLYQAALQSGFKAQGCESDIKGLIDHGEPCILHVVPDEKSEHYVVCFGTIQNNDNKELKFIIGDPAKGLNYLTQTELESIWKSKTCLILEPNEEFKKSLQIRSEKKKWIINLVKGDYPMLVIAIVLGVGIAVLSMVMALFSQKLIDELLPKKEFTKLYLGIGLVFLLLVIKEGLSALRQYFLIRQGKEFNVRIIDFFYHRLLHLPKLFFDTRKIGEFTARFSDTSRIQRVISQLAGSTAIDSLMVIVTTTFIFFYSWQIGIACLLFMPVYYLLIYLHNKSIIEGQRNIMVSYATAEGNYISTLQGIEPIKNHNQQKIFSSVNKAIYGIFQENIFSLGKIQIRLSFLANTIGVVFMMAVLAFMSYRVLNDQMTVGEMIAVLSISGTLLPSVANLALITIPINEAKIAFDRMFEFTGIEPEKEDGLAFSRFNALEVKKISFRFAGRSPILRDISFGVKKGEVIAIMGENGSGKSTLVHILQKHYQKASGEIIVNKNHLLDGISINEWRKVVGIVPQHIHIFNGSVLDNIAFEEVGNNAQHVLSFLQEYGFASFIDSLPQSYMTLVGEEGINLSGGQKQMIALARALYFRPQLLILDEATSAMDRNSEQFVLKLLIRLKEEMGVIFITHRLHILKSLCVRIYILENGKITAAGNHEQLLSEQNLYSKYWSDLISV